MPAARAAVPAAVGLAALLARAAPAERVARGSNPVGINIDGVDYRGRTQPFVNLIRQSQPFMSLRNGSARSRVDGSGWPTEDFSVDLQTLGADLAGDYAISCVGAATVTSRADGVVGSQSYDPRTNRQRAVLTISSSAATTISLNFSETAGGVRNISVLLPGFTESEADDINPAYVSQLRRFSPLRMLAMLPFNRDFITSWDQRTRIETNPSWTTFCCPLERKEASVPWEVVIKLANTVGVDVWLNMPVTADDDYFTQLATLLLGTLNPSINVIIEFGNEMWNGGFPSEWRIKEMANTSVREHQDPYRLNYDSCDDAQTWGSRLTAYNGAVRVPNLFGRVFGSMAVGPGRRIRPVLGGQASYTAFIGGQLAYLEATQPGALDKVHATTAALYFNLGKSRNTKSMSEDQVLDALGDSLATFAPNIRSPFASLAAFSRWHGVPEVLGYEAGPDTFNGNSVPAKAKANLSPRMQTMVEQMYTTWHQYGFGTLNYFHAGANTYDWPFGQWAIQTSMHNTTTAKNRALDNVRTRARPAPTIGTALPWANYSASHYVGYYEAPGKPAPPHITWIPTNSSFYYLLRAAQVGQYTVVLHTATANGNVSCELEVGVSSGSSAGRTVERIRLPPTANHGVFTAAPPVTVSVAAGLSVLRLRTLPDQSGCATLQPQNPQQPMPFAVGWIDIQ